MGVDVDGGLGGEELDALVEEEVGVGVVGEVVCFRGVWWWWWDVCDEESPWEADLWCGEADAWCVEHELDHAVGDGADVVVDFGDWGCGLAEGGVRVVEDAEVGGVRGLGVGWVHLGSVYGRGLGVGRGWVGLGLGWGAWN